MIHAVMVMNTQGKPRLSKFYDYQPPEKQQELIRSVYGVLSGRPENVSNFVEAGDIFGPVLETSSEEVMRAVEEITRLEKTSNAMSIVPKSVTGRLGR